MNVGEMLITEITDFKEDKTNFGSENNQIFVTLSYGKLGYGLKFEGTISFEITDTRHSGAE